MTDYEFLLEVFELKQEERAWIPLFEIEENESVADHTWGTAFLVLFFGKQMNDIDTNKALKIAVVHDLAEARMGDVANKRDDQERQVSSSEKAEKEQRIWEEWGDKLGGSRLKEFWKEYERKESLEAKFVKDCDLIDLCLQAFKPEKNDSYPEELESEYENLDEVFENSRRRLKTGFGRQKFREIERKYEEAKG
jgi:putative hydrolase of HD superfamily